MLKGGYSWISAVHAHPLLAPGDNLGLAPLKAVWVAESTRSQGAKTQRGHPYTHLAMCCIRFCCLGPGCCSVLFALIIWRAGSMSINNGDNDQPIIIGKTMAI